MTGVVEAIAAVMEELPGIGKGDKAPEGYLYRGIEAVAREVQPLLAKHKVVIVPKATVTSVVPSPAMKDGWQDVHMSVDWLIAGPDGSTLEARTTGIGRDKSDKGANKAQTQAFKYLLLHLLCIADTNDDSDGATYEHERHDGRTTSAPSGDFLAEFNKLDAPAKQRTMKWLRDQGYRPNNVPVELHARALEIALGGAPAGGVNGPPSSADGAESRSAAATDLTGSASAPPAPPTDPPMDPDGLTDPRAAADRVVIDRLAGRIEALPDELRVDCFAHLEGEGIDLDKLTVGEVAEVSARIGEFEAKVTDGLSMTARAARNAAKVGGRS